MHPLLRLFTLWLIALALPIQGAAAVLAGADGVARPAVAAMAAADTPASMAATQAAPCCPHCPHPGDDAKAGCGSAFAGLQAVAVSSALAVAPPAARTARAPRASPAVPAALFLTGGPDRPPRPLLA